MLRQPGVVILKTMAHQGPISITMPGRLNLLSKVSSMTHRPMQAKPGTLRIKLAPDGMLLDIKPEGGDPALCQAALAAAKLAKIPKPPSQAVYEVFKNAPLDFKP